MMAKCRITSSTRSNALSNLLSRKGAKLSAMPQTTPFTMQPMNKKSIRHHGNQHPQSGSETLGFGMEPSKLPPIFLIAFCDAAL